MKQWARTLKRDAHALYLAAGDPRVPSYAKALAIAVGRIRGFIRYLGAPSDTLLLR
jgi:hypothetical protein